MMLYNRMVTLLGLFVCLLVATPCRAGFEVYVRNAVMTAGSRGYVDVIFSGSVHPVNSFAYTITITGASESAGNVVFSQEVVDITNISGAELGETVPYVFFGHSSSPSAYIPSDPLVPPNTVLSGDDVLNDGELDINGEFLLARLNIEHQGGLDSNLSSADFALTLSDVAFSYSVPDEEFGEIRILHDPNQITTRPGTLTITATPEPATLGVLGIASIFAARNIQKRRRKAASA